MREQFHFFHFLNASFSFGKDLCEWCSLLCSLPEFQLARIFKKYCFFVVIALRNLFDSIIHLKGSPHKGHNCTFY